MKHFSGFLFLLVAFLPFISMLASGPRREARLLPARETLAVLSPHRREVRLEYARAYDAWRAAHGKGRVDIQWLDVGGTSKILKELESRFATAPDNPGVDLFFGGGVAAFQIAVQKGWLAPTPLPPEVLEHIPPTCAGIPVYDPAGLWHGVALSGFGIIDNRILIRRMGLPTPSTWEDLARPEYLGWVASGDPRSSGSVYKCYEIILQAAGFEGGWALITRLCANVRRFGEGGGVAPREVAAGDVAAGMVIDQYAQTVIDSIGSDALGFVLPQGATVIDSDPIAMIRGAPHPDLARDFTIFVLSAEGQRVLFQPVGVDGQRYALHRMPVRKDLYDGPHAPASRPYEYRSSFQYSELTERKRAEAVKSLIGTFLIDAHSELVAAWQTVIREGLPPARLAELTAPPLTEEELARVAGEWSDARRQLDIRQGWAAEAHERFRRIAAGAPHEP